MAESGDVVDGEYGMEFWGGRGWVRDCNAIGLLAIEVVYLLFRCGYALDAEFPQQAGGKWGKLWTGTHKLVTRSGAELAVGSRTARCGIALDGRGECQWERREELEVVL